VNASLKNELFKEIVIFIFEGLFYSILVKVKQCHADLQIGSECKLDQLLCLDCLA
jgi:hypothetical protein